MNTKKPQACDVTENRFRVILTFLRMAGVPINMKKASILNSIYNVLTAINVYAMYIGMYVDIFTKNDDLKNFLKTFRIVNASSVAYWAHLTLSWRLHDFERLLRLTESFTWEDQPTRDPHTGHRTLAGWIPHLQEVLKCVYAISLFSHLLQSGVRMYASHELMYRAQYPFDTVSSPGYELVTIMQIFAANFILSAFLGFQFLYATLIMVACSQLQKLRTNLLDIKQELVPSGADSGSDGGEEPVSRSEDVFCRMQMQLNECVRHHQAILQYVITFTVHTFATPIYMTNSFSFPLLYATVVMVACSQLQKLRTNLLDIKQELVPSGADSGSDGGEESVSHSEDGFCRMQTQLNECVRHHQAILQYVITFRVHARIVDKASSRQETGIKPFNFFASFFLFATLLA
ncbi:hypothetical protein B7P43_G08622 [Cryptotermes secundus]|uniref:Odorant receptor n=1 Tax=Cryptotermes secundus TaxID=105785 RepID=A0A2J7Q636_9NEOP|nr:hypothetical protein B7P43_G08622 [Cryptotermes secundus]